MRARGTSRRGDAGNAVLEFVVFSAFLLVPLIYDRSSPRCRCKGLHTVRPRPRVRPVAHSSKPTR